MYIKELDVSELAEMQENGSDFVLFDVRSPAEIAAGVIDGTLPLPLNLLPLRMDEIPKDKQVVFYCRTGARSAQACMYMARYGYDNVYNLRGGIVTWAQNRLPVAPGLSMA